MAETGIVTNVLYIVMDVVLILLGLLFVSKWGKQGMLALTMWLLVGGMMVQTVGDVLGTLGENFKLDTELIKDGAFTLGLGDITYWGALLLWMVAFFIPVKFALIDAKKGPQPADEGAPPADGQQAPAGAPPQGQPPVPQGQPPVPPGQPPVAPPPGQ